MVGFLHVRVVDQVIAQFVFPGGKGSLVATHTEELIGNRTISKQMRFIDRSTYEKIQRTHRYETLLSDQLIPGFLGDIGNDAFFPCQH